MCCRKDLEDDDYADHVAGGLANHMSLPLVKLWWLWAFINHRVGQIILGLFAGDFDGRHMTAKAAVVSGIMV